MSWIAVHTKPKAEHVAVMNLQRQGYGTYLPLAVEGDASEARPMFPDYVFVDLEPNEGLWRPVVSTRGVLRVLMTGEAPSRVPIRALDLLRRREEAGVIRLKRIVAAKSFEPGQAVRVHEGALTGFEGVFERMSGEERVWVLLNIMGREVQVEVQAQTVAAA